MELMEKVKYEDWNLGTEWVFYEVRETFERKKTEKAKMSDYLNNIIPVFTFKNLIDFLHFWKNTDYSKITPLLIDPHQGIIRKIKDTDLKIGSIALFKSGISPTWEDKVNAKGGEYGMRFSEDDPSKIAARWEKIIFSLVGGTFDGLDEVQ